MDSTNNSLLKYDSPVLVSKDAKKLTQGRPAKPSSHQPTDSAQVPSKPKLPLANKEQIEDLLNYILPHREWIENGELWRQQVSSEPGTRFDVAELQQKLDQNLKERKAREEGICPIRRELYSQCFDELIRQVTINCSERGLLLSRLNDEIKMTIACYQSLYVGSFAFSMRKSLQAKQEMSIMEKKIAELESEKMELENQLNEQIAKSEAMEEEENVRRKAVEKKHEEEVEFLKCTNHQLKTQLEEVVAQMK